MARIQCEYCPITFARPYGASRHIRQYYDAHFVPHNPSEHACQLPANQDCRRRLGGDIAGTRCMRTSGDVIGRKASQKTPQTMILSPVIRQLMSPVLLTLRKMAQMSLNRINWDRNRDRCHGTVEIVTEVLMVTEVPSTPDSSPIHKFLS